MAGKHYLERTPEDYLEQMDEPILQSLNPQQIREFKRLLQAAIPKPSSKIVDLRVILDFLVAKYYVVIWVGQDRRQHPRQYAITRLTRAGNLVMASLLLVGLNLTVTASLFLAVYLLKSALGIDLFPGHLGDSFHLKE